LQTGGDAHRSVMVTPVRRIVPMGGGGFSMEPRNHRLDKWLLSLSRRRRPRVLFVPTASGDSAGYIQRFYRAFGNHPCEPAHLGLFDRSASGVRETIVSSDVIYVGGGNTANLLAVWRVHGVDRALRDAWHDGVVLCGVSAGAICWFEAGVTDSFGPDLQPLHGGLGMLRGSFCPHYNDAARRPAYERLVAGGDLPPGYAADDGAAILFDDTAIADVVRSRPGVAAYRVAHSVTGAVQETLHARLLPR
jgi:dipeptidase E